MNMQKQKRNQLTSAAAEADQTQKLIIPKVRYHPTIQIQPHGDGARAKTRITPTKKTRPAAAQRPVDNKPVQQKQNVHPSPQVDPGPALSPAARRKQSSKKPVQGPDTDPDHLPDRAPPTPDQVPLGIGVQMDSSTVEEVEVLTRGQRVNPDWFTWRKNRITASVAHRIAHCRFVNGKSNTPPKSYLPDIIGEGRRFQTRAMTWGITMEAEAVRRYQKMKSVARGRSVLVQECGLFIDAQRPWLAASPDGIVTDSRTGQRLLCLEVKCPYKHRNQRVEDACRDDKDFCLEIQDQEGQKPGGPPAYSLKTSHSYFTQIQCQLAVTGLEQADLVVFTLKEVAIVPVTFDPDLWEETVSKLEVYYRNIVLPHLRLKMRPDMAAARTPEL